MSGKFILSPAVLAEPFWDVMLRADDERGAERERFLARFPELEALRTKADYNTGSISAGAAWSLYSLVRHFGLTRAIEVGTFIGRSTLAMASAMDDGGRPGEIFTCDLSNALDLPWAGQTRITQFKAATSTVMLGQLDGAFDLAFLDGRLQGDDVERLEQLLSPDALIALDDFEGMEKGVANLSLLRRTARFRSHALIYPCPRSQLQARGFSSPSLFAVLLPPSRIAIAAQG